MSERLTDERIVELGQQARRILEFARGDVPVGTMGMSAADVRAVLTELYERRSHDLTAEDVAIIDRALVCWSSDYNDAPHDKIQALRNRLLARANGGGK